MHSLLKPGWGFLENAVLSQLNCFAKNGSCEHPTKHRQVVLGCLTPNMGPALGQGLEDCRPCTGSGISEFHLERKYLLLTGPYYDSGIEATAAVWPLRREVRVDCPCVSVYLQFAQNRL